MRHAYGALILLVCAGCSPPRPYFGPTPEGVDARPFFGCYQAAYPAGAVTYLQNPWYLRLDSLGPDDRIGGGREKPGARRASASNQGDDEGAWWRLIPGGVQLYIGDTLHGAYYEFTPRGDSLVGRDFTQTDILPARRHSDKLSARRVPCPQGGWPRGTPGGSAG